ncbi:hypothetical protein BBR01nite_38440 [Brevibacillus brevis]|nr:hypothetical protein BBR01nite_38440 [Brevibacillus brevis]
MTLYRYLNDFIIDEIFVYLVFIIRFVKVPIPTMKANDRGNNCKIAFVDNDSHLPGCVSHKVVVEVVKKNKE